MKTNIIYNGDCLEQLKELDDNSVDSVVTDPPYGLGKEPNPQEVMKDWIEKGYHEIKSGRGFMGKEWDKFIPQPIIWKEVYRVLKPGGHMLVASGTRTHDWLTMSLRFAGFEVRDCISHLFGSGFPKSHNISKAMEGIIGKQSKGFKSAGDDGRKAEFKQDLSKRSDYGYIWKPTNENAKKWEGWGTAIKPAQELWSLVRKPLSEKNVALNVLKWETGGINIDGCRIGSEERIYKGGNKLMEERPWNKNQKNKPKFIVQGRFPSNLILECTCDEVKEGKEHTDPNCPCYMLDEQAPQTGAFAPVKKGQKSWGGEIYHKFKTGGDDGKSYHNEGLQGASRFFKNIPKDTRFLYVSKASKSERNKGTDSFINIEVLKVICKEKSLTKEERLVKLSVDMGVFQGRDIEEFGTQKKEDSKWNTLLFGKNIMEKYQKDIQSIIKTETNSTTQLKILNWLKHLFINEYTLDANSLMENGGNLVENVEKSKELIITINEKLASALGVKDVVLGMQLKIRLSEGKCDHPCVKPIKLMQYLVRLVTPKEGIVLDPFIGSGTTAIACKLEGMNYIGIEKEEEYIKIAEERIKYYDKQEKLGKLR